MFYILSGLTATTLASGPRNATKPRPASAVPQLPLVSGPWSVRHDPLRGEGVPALLSIESNFSVVHPATHCGAPEFIDCLVDAKNVFFPQHFSHAAEIQLPCWSLFRTYWYLKPRIVAHTHSSFQKARGWSLHLQQAMGYTVVLYSGDSLRNAAARGTNGCGSFTLENQVGAGSATTASNGSSIGGRPTLDAQHWGFQGCELQFLSNPAHAAALHARLKLAAPNDTEEVRVGLLNRAGARRVTNAEELVAAAASLSIQGMAGKRARISANEVADLGHLSFAEQARWVHAQDLIIAPHGAQNINFLWARRCTAILELYPKHYYLPSEMLQLARAVGAVPFAGYVAPHGPGSAPYQDRECSQVGMCAGGTGGAKTCHMAARTVELHVDAPTLKAALLSMLEARRECLSPTSTPL